MYTHRERYVRSLLFESVDKIPFQPGYPRESTLEMWHKQGLPEGVDYFTVLCDVLGITQPVTTEPEDVGVSLKMFPKFEGKVLDHKDGHYIVQDWSGAIVEISEKYDITYLQVAKDFVTRRWHKFPVENRGDWEEMKKRYNPSTPGHLPENLVEKCKELKNRSFPLNISIYGPFSQLRQWCGFENLCFMLMDDPDFVMEMAEFWKNFVFETISPVLKNVELDRAWITEDMAYKEHSMISPAMVREFIVPSYKKWIPELRKSGCRIIDMDSDGYLGEFIPIWIESGFNCCEPIEVAAGNDIIKMRKIFGNKMAYRGGIDKREIAKGGKAMEEEVMRVVPPLLKDGGFIPGCDHGVPPDISWPDYVEYSRLLAKLTGWL